MALHVDNAEASLASLGLPGGVAAAADSVLRLVNGGMAGAARQVSTARGIDPRDFTLVAYGGGGPLHAAQVADEIDITRVLVPWSPGLVSAFGLLVADTLIDASESAPHILSHETLDEARLEHLRALASKAAGKNGLAPGSYDIALGLDMRYAGQAFELTIWADDAPAEPSKLRELFESEHSARYGYARPSLTVEVVSYRVRLARRSSGSLRPPLPAGRGAPPEEIWATIGGQRLKTKFIARDALAVNATLAGPAVVEEPTATTLVPPGWRVQCLPTGDLLLERLP
jgi:N-methylhydantoinase A